MRRSFGSIEEITRGELYRLHWRENGTRKSKRVRGSKRDAERELAVIQVGSRGGGDKTTFDEYWSGVVQPSIQRLSPKTIAEYERTWNVELQPRIGHLRVSDMNFRKAQNVILSVNAPSVQKKCRMLLHKICRMAVEQDNILGNNPVTKDTYTHPITTTKKQLIEASEIHVFLDSIRNLKYEMLLLVELGGGLRPEEACALRMSDITYDDEYAYVDVNKTSITINGRMLLQDTTKTERSTREVVIGEPFASRIKELHKQTDEPICANLTGSFTSPATITHNWKQLCVRRDYKYVPQGNMRNSWSQMHSEAGSPDSLVSLAMGHTDGTTRGKHYLQATRKSGQLIADILGEYLANNTV